MDIIGKETLLIMKTVVWYNNWLFGFLQKHLKGNILEVGAGIGNFTKLLAKKGKVYATDFNRDYIKELKKKFRLKRDVGVTVAWGDIEKGQIPFKRVKFDTAVCMNVLEHIKDDKAALFNMQRRLKSGGKLLLLVPAVSLAYGELDRQLGHFRRYSKRGLLNKMNQAGFETIDCRYVNSIGIFGWFVNARLLQRTIIPKRQLDIFNYIARPFLMLENRIRMPFGLSLFVVARKSNKN